MSSTSPLPRLLSRGIALAVALLLVLEPAASAAWAAPISHGSRTRPMVALTFDDGWSTDRCRAIANTLRAYDAPATFFIVGRVVASAPATWRSILRGFPVANHTWSHRHLRELSGWTVRKQIAEAESAVERALGRQMLKVLRPPYGEYDDTVLRVAGDLGYRYVLTWDVSSADTSPSATTSRIIQNATRGTNGSVVLMHCGPAVTPPAVDDIIRIYRSRGYQLVTLGRLLGL